MLILLSILFATYWWLGFRYCKAKQQEIPSLAEIQTMIGAISDGVYGAETKRLWKRALNNQYAEKYDYDDMPENARKQLK